MRRCLLVAALLLLVPASAGAQLPAAGSYLTSRLDGSGCAAEPGATASVNLTAWAALGLVASGRRADRAASCIAARAATLRDITEIELAVLALVAAGRDPRSAGGRDLVAVILNAHRGGRIGTTVASNQFGILALRAAGAPVPASARRTLLADRAADGGWPVARGGDSDSNLTASGISAAIALRIGPRSAIVNRAIASLRPFRSGGGYALFAGGRADAQSTAWVLSGLAAARRTDRAAERWLAALQYRDGSYAYQRGQRITPVWVTAQAAMGLAARSFPMRP